MESLKIVLVVLIISFYIDAESNSESKSNEAGANEIYVYDQEIPANFQQLTVDEVGVVVVTRDKFDQTNSQDFGHLVLYSLDHEGLLKWITEDDEMVLLVFDSVTTSQAIYVVHSVPGLTDRRAVTKFNRVDGSLAWRHVLVESKNAFDQFLRVSEDGQTIVVSGVVDQLPQLWWLDDIGNLKHHWQEDSESARIFDVIILPDLSVLMGIAVFNDFGEIQVRRISDLGATLFHYTKPSEVVLSQNYEDFSLLETSQNSLLISYNSEDIMGLPRLHQIILDVTGKELFADIYVDLTLGFEKRSQLLKADGSEVVNMAQITFPTDNGPSVQIFNMDLDGVIGLTAYYGYQINGRLKSVYQFALNQFNEIFMIARVANPFPDMTSDTLYLHFSSELELCSVRRTSGSDALIQVDAFNNDFYELRSIKNNINNTFTLHVKKHVSIACDSEQIFYSGFESLLN